MQPKADPESHWQLRYAAQAMEQADWAAHHAASDEAIAAVKAFAEEARSLMKKERGKPAQDLLLGRQDTWKAMAPLAAGGPDSGVHGTKPYAVGETVAAAFNTAIGALATPPKKADGTATLAGTTPEQRYQIGLAQALRRVRNAYAAAYKEVYATTYLAIRDEMANNDLRPVQIPTLEEA